MLPVWQAVDKHSESNVLAHASYSDAAGGEALLQYCTDDDALRKTRVYVATAAIDRRVKTRFCFATTRRDHYSGAAS
eukprot:19158-Heterococcus_DN1.PRE.2